MRLVRFAPQPAHRTRCRPSDLPEPAGKGSAFPGRGHGYGSGYKLHRRADKAGKASYALYDLAGDAQEQNDVAAGHPERVQRMRADLEAWQKSVVRSLNGEDYR